MTPEALAGAWEATQQLVRSRSISAGHDISDGGVAVALLEMAFAGNIGIEVQGLRCPNSCHQCSLVCTAWNPHLPILPGPCECCSRCNSSCHRRMRESTVAVTPLACACAQVDLPAAQGSPHGALAALFAEELGLLLEVAPEHEEAVCSAYEAQGLRAEAIGTVSTERGVSISVGGQPCISGAQRTLLLRHVARMVASFVQAQSK